MTKTPAPASHAVNTAPISADLRGIEQPEALPTVELVGIKDGVETSLGKVAMPPSMKARDLLREYGFGDFQDDMSQDSCAMAAMDSLIEYCHRYYAAPAAPVAENNPEFPDGCASPASPAQQDALTDTEMLNILQSECWDLRCISVPTGGDDAEVNWLVIEHHMAAPHEREVGRSFTDNPREAIRDAVGSLSNIALAACAAPAQAQQDAPAAAWMTPEGDRVVTEATMAGARKDGGAMLSSSRGYTVELVRAGARQDAPAAQPARECLQQSASAARDPAVEKPAAGRYVLAWMEGRGTPIRAMWVPSKWLKSDNECPEDWAEYDEAEDEYFCPEGWYEKNEHEEKNWSVSTPIVAWMELPRLAAALQAAPPAPAGVAVLQEPQLSADTLYLLRRLLSNQHTLTGPEFRAELTKIVDEAFRTQAPPAPEAVAVPGLVDRVRPGVEAAPWVCAAIAKQDAELECLRAALAAPAQPLAPAFADGLLHSTVLHKLWEESEPTAQRGQPGALAWQLGVFAGKVAQAAAAPAQAVAVPAGSALETVAWLNKPILVQDGEKIDDLPPTVDFERHAAAHEWEQAEPLVRLSDALAYAQSMATPAQEHATQLAGQGQEFPRGFLADVMTAAGLVTHGKQCKALGERLAAGCMAYRAAAPVQAKEDARNVLDHAELQEIQRAVEQFADCGETDVDYALLMRAAQAGYLECTHFQVVDEAALNLAAARAAQGGAA